MRWTWAGLGIVVLACGPSVGVDDSGDTGVGTADGDDDDHDDDDDDSGGPSTADGSDGSDDDDADDDGPICLVGDPDRVAFCDIVGGCEADEECGDGYVCDFEVGYCVPVETCVANADCGGTPCFEEECKHIACVDDRTCGADAICFDGWCTMIDDPPMCDDSHGMVELSFELPEGTSIDDIAYVEPSWGPGIAVARGDDVLMMVNVTGPELALEPDVSTAPVIVFELASGYLLSPPDGPARDLFVGGFDVAMMLATPDGFDAPIVVDDALAPALDVSVARTNAHAAALVDDGSERRVMFFDGSSGVFELIGEDVAAGDVDDISIHEGVGLVLAVGPSAAEWLELDGGGLQVFDSVSFPAERPALVGTFVEPSPVGRIVAAVATGGEMPMLVAYDIGGPELVVPLPSTPNAIVAASFDDAEAIVVAANTGLDRFFFEDGICSSRLMTSIGPRHLAVADEHLDGDHELAIASDTAVAFLR